MSRIIRSINAQPADDKPVEIKFHNLFEPEHYEEVQEDEIETTPQLTLEEVMAERQAMLANAEHEIAAERQNLEQYRDEQLQAIEALKQTWEEEKVVLQQEAYETGFAQGYEDGVQKANVAMSEAVYTANETMQLAEDNAKSYLDAQEQVILELGLTSAERILNASLERDDELYVSIVKRALKEAREMKEIKIFVSPQYHGVVTKYRDELAEMFPIDVPFMIFVNEDLTQSESYIETNHGRIVVSIDDQLQELKRKLVEILDSKE